MHGGPVKEMFSCSNPPGTHLLLSPSRGRPSESTFCPAAATLAPAVAVWVAAAGPVTAGPRAPAPDVGPAAVDPSAAVDPAPPVEPATAVTPVLPLAPPPAAPCATCSPVP